MSDPLSPTKASFFQSSSSLGSTDSGFRTSSSRHSLNELKDSPCHKATPTPKRPSSKRRSWHSSYSSVQSQHTSPSHPSYAPDSPHQHQPAKPRVKVPVEESAIKELRDLEAVKTRIEVQIRQLEMDLSDHDKHVNTKPSQDDRFAKRVAELEFEVEQQRKFIQNLEFEGGQMRHRIKSLEFQVDSMQRWLHSAPSSTSLDTMSINSEPPPREDTEMVLQQAVVSNLPLFIRYTDWNCLVSYLVAARLLSVDKAEVMLSPHKDQTEKGNYFYIHILPYAGWDAYRKLYKCLESERDHSGHSSLLRILHAATQGK